MSILEDAARSHAEPVHLKDKADIIDYYRAAYPGRDKRGNEAWKPIAAAALSGTTDKKSLEYKAAIRQFQGTRINEAAGPRRASSYEGLGKQLPPDHYTPKGDVSGTITVRQAGGASGTREREFSYSFTGSDAYDFVNNPTLDAVLGKAGGNDYPQDIIDRLTGKSGYGDKKSDPTLIIEGAT